MLGEGGIMNGKWGSEEPPTPTPHTHKHILQGVDGSFSGFHVTENITFPEDMSMEVKLLLSPISSFLSIIIILILKTLFCVVVNDGQCEGSSIH